MNNDPVDHLFEAAVARSDELMARDEAFLARPALVEAQERFAREVADLSEDDCFITEIERGDPPPTDRDLRNIGRQKELRDYAGETFCWLLEIFRAELKDEAKEAPAPDPQSLGEDPDTMWSGAGWSDPPPPIVGALPSGEDD